MPKFTHLLVLSVLVVWLAGSGCVGNDTPEAEESGIDPNVAETGNGAENVALETDPAVAEIQELEAEMPEIEGLLENASLKEDIVIEEL